MCIQYFFPGDIMNVHRDSDVNNCQTPFKFTDENMKRVEAIIAKYPPEYRVSLSFLLITDRLR